LVMIEMPIDALELAGGLVLLRQGIVKGLDSGEWFRRSRPRTDR
jgi:hypothetical protein